MTRHSDIAAVVIGRNEGERLLRSLASLESQVALLIYVDSGSTDGSLDAAKGFDAKVVEIDQKTPFTAARARNAGLAAIGEDPAIRFVQFVDGDCEVDGNWLSTARQFLTENTKAAVVCGRRRERFPDASLWNRLIDEEWASLPGKTKSCGGDALMRKSALDEVGDFNPALIAGEEPELCVRLRQAGWIVWRLDAEMTLHDAAMTRLSQWWSRARRAGYTYAEGVAMHGRPPERHNVEKLRRSLVWGLGVPLLTVAGLFATPWALLILLAYPAQVLRLVRRGYRPTSAVFLTLAKFAEVQGIATWVWRRFTRTPSELIEYK